MRERFYVKNDQDCSEKWIFIDLRLEIKETYGRYLIFVVDHGVNVLLDSFNGFCGVTCCFNEAVGNDLFQHATRENFVSFDLNCRKNHFLP